MRRIVPLAAVIVVVAIPIAVLASHQFADVPDSQPFHTEIGWMRDNNITQGSTECGSPPPEQTFYCPESNVRRDAMAAFLYRVANNQVVDAGKLEGQSLGDLDGRYVNHGQADSVTSAMIVDGNVTSPDIADGQVTANDLASNSVTGAHILDNTVGSLDITNFGVQNSDLAANAVTGDKIQDNTVGSQDITNFGVQNSDLAPSAVTSDKIADNTIGSQDIATGGVQNSNLATNAVTSDKIQDNTIGTQDIATGGVTNTDLAFGSVTTANIVDNTIGSQDIANGTITFQDWAAACVAGQVPKSTGTGWVCGNDNDTAAPGASGTSSGVWASLSDRNAKEAFRAADSRSVLAGVVGLDISSWRYQGEDTSVRHLGPTAQDFAAAFGLGDSKTHIANVDANGVALAAIQGLNQKVEALEARLADADTPESGAVPIWALLTATAALSLGIGRRWGLRTN